MNPSSLRPSRNLSPSRREFIRPEPPVWRPPHSQLPAAESCTAKTPAGIPLRTLGRTGE